MSGGVGTTIAIRAPQVHATLVVEAQRAFGPRDVDRLLGSLGRTLRALNPGFPILVVAPWLSSRTRELLSAEGLNHLDLTGNAFVRLENPAVFIQSQGATRNPSPAPRGKARIRGPKAWRLIRFLVDVRPPYRVKDIAAATRLTPGYVSRLLDALDDEALVERSQRGRVVAVEVGGLLRHWAENYDVFGANQAQTYLSPPGAARTLPLLADVRAAGRIGVTGSFAAVRFVAIAAPALLCAYADDTEELAGELGLLPADEGANIALLRPFDPVVWERTTTDGGVTYVAPSQVAVDCLTGNGRMPAEGEALIDWMLASESSWRLDSAVTP